MLLCNKFKFMLFLLLLVLELWKQRLSHYLDIYHLHVKHWLPFIFLFCSYVSILGAYQSTVCWRKVSLSGNACEFTAIKHPILSWKHFLQKQMTLPVLTQTFVKLWTTSLQQFGSIWFVNMDASLSFIQSRK